MLIWTYNEVDNIYEKGLSCYQSLIKVTFYFKLSYCYWSIVLSEVP